MEDDVYRLGIAWQNVAYNQPAHLGYNLTEGLRTPVITLKDNLFDGITVKFTKACDGVYGHTIEGYEIYRSTNGSDYELIGTTSAKKLKYNDKTADKDTEYTYKVAAVVDGKTSYYSFAVSNK